MWRIIFTIVGLLALLALIWFVGPFISIADWAPLDEIWEQIVATAVVLSIFGIVILIRWLIRRRRAKKLEEGIVEQAAQDDTPILREKMEDALATLKKSSKRGGAAALYELPWYIIIGPPGAGKTTALINSGQKFPLAGPGGPRAIAGFGGTRHCDWWFTEDAVLIDTAGRYTTQDSDAAADSASWQGFVDLLKDTRPRQPINGAIVCISISDIMGLDQAELNAHAAAIRQRLDELHARLGIQFPVYVMFTKMDLISGFMEFFGDLTEEQRKIVWGHTFDPDSKTDNMVAQFPAEFDALMDRLSTKLTDRMQEEVDARSRTQIFGFPAQMASLKQPINDFLVKVFEPTRYSADAVLRGVYFTSGTQEGTPFDRVLGALSRSFGASGAPAPVLSGQGKSFFLSDLLAKVIFLEQGWVGTDMRHIRRKFVSKAVAYVCLFAAVSGATALLVNSYLENKELVGATDQALGEYRELAANTASEVAVSDTDFGRVLPILHKLRHLPAGYQAWKDDETSPISASFGLDQRPRIEYANVQAYREGLQRYFLPRLILRVENQIVANQGNTTFLYEALKVYLMLGNQAALEPELVRNWMKRDWEKNLFRGAEYEQGRAQLLSHLDALLERLPPPPKPGADPDPSRVDLNGPLVQATQATLARMPVAERAYTLMKGLAESATFQDWSPADPDVGGADVTVVFETQAGDPLDTLVVDGFYTYRGFHEGVLGTMEAVVASVANESWVIGDAGGEVIDAQFRSIRKDILEIYRNDFIRAWDDVLKKLRMKSVTGDQGMTVLNALGAPGSPLRKILRSLRKQTELTVAPAPATPGGDGAAALPGAGSPEVERVTDFATGEAINRGRTQGERLAIELALGAAGPGGARAEGEPLPPSPGERIEAYFKDLHDFAGTAEGEAPVDNLVAIFEKIWRQKGILASSPSATVAAQAQAELDAQIVALEAAAERAPGEVKGVAKEAAANLKGEAGAGAKDRLGRLLANNVTSACTAIVTNKYPFYATSSRDVTVGEFASLFAPNGVMDAFFKEHLDNMVDRGAGAKNWRWRTDVGVGKLLSNATLREFERAYEIRQAFFPAGSAAPKIDFTITPISLDGALSVIFTVGSARVVYEHGGANEVPAVWPVPPGGEVSVAVAPEIAGTQNRLFRDGEWALFKLLSGRMLPRGNEVTVSFDIGGRKATFKLRVLAGDNPFTLPALREFRCPTGF